MRRVSYLNRASRRFLEGTKCKTPCEAVEMGIRSLEAWAHVLAEEREIEAQYLLSRRLARRERKVFRALSF